MVVCYGLVDVILDAFCVLQNMIGSVLQLACLHFFSHVVAVLISSGIAFLVALCFTQRQGCRLVSFVVALPQKKHTLHDHIRIGTAREIPYSV